MDSLVQDCGNSIANAMELLQSSTKPSISIETIGSVWCKTMACPSFAVQCWVGDSTFCFPGSTPLWIFALSRFAGPQSGLPGMLYDFELWLGACAAAYGLGAVLAHLRPSCSEALLNWLLKPLLLLFSLLFVTIGVYINIYVFHLPDIRIPIAAGLLPMMAFCTGSLAGYLTRREEIFVKVISTETTILNCLAVLTMIRFSLPQPQADLTSALPIWVLVMTPFPFFSTFIFQKLRERIRKRCAKRKERKYRHFSIASSLLNVTNVTNLSASITPKMNSPNDEIDDNSKLIDMIDEKVTVL